MKYKCSKCQRQLETDLIGGSVEHCPICNTEYVVPYSVFHKFCEWVFDSFSWQKIKMAYLERKEEDRLAAEIEKKKQQEWEDQEGKNPFFFSQWGKYGID